MVGDALSHGIGEREYLERFRGGLVFKAHRWLYHSTLGSRVIKKKKRRYLEHVRLRGEDIFELARGRIEVVVEGEVGVCAELARQEPEWRVVPAPSFT